MADNDGLVERVRAAAVRAKDARERWLLLQEQRDELIVRAVDSGASQREVAAAAGIQKSRVVGILGSVGFEEAI